MHGGTNKLWLCLRFKQLPLISISKAAECTAAVAVLEKQRVLLANDEAAELGVKPGQGAATARTLADNITLLERDPAAEERCLQQLCCWAYGISPSLYPYREDSLLLEIGSCLMLYGSIEALLEKVHSDLSCRGYSYHHGLAATPKGAWLLSYSPSLSIDPPQGLEEQLAPLPLSLLPDFPQQRDALAKAGLWNFGDIMGLPQRALARRCGRKFVHQLQQILGNAEDRVPDFQPPDSFSDNYWFGYEVKANQELLPAAQLLLQSMCRFLRNTQLQSQQVEWLLYGINRQLHRFEVRCSLDHASWQEWYQLTQLKVDQLQLDMGIEGIGLSCGELSPGSGRSDDLFDRVGQREPLNSLLDRLTNRLGLQSVRKIACRDEHLPEFAAYSSCDTRLQPVDSDNQEQQRPFWLMPEPQRLHLSGEQPCWNGPLTLIEGPERIEDNWWAEAVSRDYYVAGDPGGQQYWIYRDRLQNNWYIQGIFS